jgi:hypothetical protein
MPKMPLVQRQIDGFEHRARLTRRIELAIDVKNLVHAPQVNNQTRRIETPAHQPRPPPNGTIGTSRLAKRAAALLRSDWCHRAERRASSG